MSETNQGTAPAAARPSDDLYDDAFANLHAPARDRAIPYYETLGKACDAIVRCQDCRELVTHAALCANKGLTPCCGTRKVREIRVLKQHEMDAITSGAIDFPHRDLFLAEFAPSTVSPTQAPA